MMLIIAKLKYEMSEDRIIFYLCEMDDVNIQEPMARLLYGRCEDGRYRVVTNQYGYNVAGFRCKCDEILERYGYLHDTRDICDEVVEVLPRYYPDKYSDRWKDRSLYYQENNDGSAKYDPHHLIRDIYYMRYPDDIDAKYDNNVLIRYKYHLRHPEEIHNVCLFTCLCY